MKQSELIKRLTDKELRQQVVLTQTVFFWEVYF